MAELSLDNIFTAEEAELLFADDAQETPTESEEENPKEDKDKDDELISSISEYKKMP